MNIKHHLYSSLPMLEAHKAYAEIDLSALRYNYNSILGYIQKSSPKSKMICVLKADAYGHGAKECCRALLLEGCSFFAVSSIEEAIDIRKVCDDENSDADILILGYAFPSQVGLLAKHNIITSLVDPEFAFALAKAAKSEGVRVRCHIKLDTGMNRIGFQARNELEIEKTVEDIKKIHSLESLEICGMFTHFSKADEASEIDEPHAETDRQAGLFKLLDSKLLDQGIDVGFRHICNTSATLCFPRYHFDACRVGIALYGALAEKHRSFLTLRPVMKLCTFISHLHTLKKGDSISYGGSYTASEDRLVATLPIGYADGFIRAYNSAELTVVSSEGVKKAPILGRICMDQCMIDVTGMGSHVGDKVVLFGNSPDELSSLAKMAGTIEYEVLCLITARAPRIYNEH